MNIPRVSSALLHEVSQWSIRNDQAQRWHAEKNREVNFEEQSKLLALQEANRLLQNYNYQKDTEWIKNYEFYESIKEQRLLAQSTVRGIFIDRYV
jgi:hypothetical protein